MEWKRRMLSLAVLVGGLCLYLPKIGLVPKDIVMVLPEIIQLRLAYFTTGNVTGGKKKTWKLFKQEELQKYTNEDNGLYLALLGKVYDVTKGSKYYGANGGYHFFTGRDASRAFVTGDFTESGLTDDVLSLTSAEIIGLEKWVQFYKKEYKYKGKLVGRYYDDVGGPTPYNHRVRMVMKEAKNNVEEVEQQRILHPPCNAEWSQDTGSRVWCTTMSGGIERDWIGVPRQLYDPGSHEYHCACIKENELQSYKGRIKEYADCDPQASSCKVTS